MTERSLDEKKFIATFIVVFGLVHVLMPWVPDIIVSTSFGNPLIHKSLILLMGIATLACVFSSYFTGRAGRVVFLVLSVILIPVYAFSAVAEALGMMEWNIGGELMYVVLGIGDVFQTFFLICLLIISLKNRERIT